jgi:metallophosphoesterase (TIGR00282 family)
MNILFFGDVVGKVGRRALQRVLPTLIERERADFVVANCENVAGGAGVDAKSCEELLAAGVDALTSGNHIWRIKDIGAYLDRPDCRLLRPANFPGDAPGRGWGVFTSSSGARVAVVNLIGRVFMASVDCPFQAGEHIAAEIERECAVVLVDMHCDATSEKGAMGWFLDGRVSAVVGSHTHVQTTDQRVLPQGTGFISDVGMCGPLDSVIGVKPELAIRRFVTQRPTRFETAAGRAVVQGASVSVDADTGRANAITRIQEFVD